MQYSCLESAKIPWGSCWQNEHFITERILKSVSSELRSNYKMRSTENDNVDYLWYMGKTFKWKADVNSLKEKKKLKTFSNYNFAFFPYSKRLYTQCIIGKSKTISKWINIKNTTKSIEHFNKIINSLYFAIFFFLLTDMVIQWKYTIILSHFLLSVLAWV